MSWRQPTGKSGRPKERIARHLTSLRPEFELRRRNPSVVPQRDIDRLEITVDGQQGAVDAAIANKQALQTKLASLLPAQKASAEAALAQAQVELDKAVVRAGVTGTVQQFTPRPGDVVNPMLRPAGILVPTEAGRLALVAGFGQIAAQVIKPGMIAEVTCIGKPLSIIPMVVAQVQDVIASGQFRPSDQIVDVLQTARPGTITTFLVPLYAGGLEGVPPGGNCMAIAYTDNHDELESGDVSAARWLFLHMVDTVAVVKAAILRIQALLLPVQTLVLTGH